MMLLLLLFLLSAVSGVPIYEQCGGEGWRGSLSCDPPLQCYRRSKWYSSCQKACPGKDWECTISSGGNVAGGARPWNQCGGQGWSGATWCTQYSCQARSIHYSQCRPDCPEGWICRGSSTLSSTNSSPTRTTTSLPTSASSSPSSSSFSSPPTATSSQESSQSSSPATTDATNQVTATDNQEVTEEESFENIREEEIESFNELAPYDPSEFEEEELGTDEFPDPSEFDIDELQQKEQGDNY